MLSWYERWPLFLRWILFLPLSLVLSFVFTLLMSLVSLVNSAGIFIRPAASIISLMYFVGILAPRAKRAWVLATIIGRMMFSASVLAFVYIYDGEFTPQTQGEIIAELIAYAICILLYRKVTGVSGSRFAL